MSTEPTQSLRDQELRRMLVATSSAEPVRPRRRSAVVASIAAFVMAGALTGGAVSAVALSADDRPATVSIKEMKNIVVYDDAQLFGTPFVLSGQGTTTIQLGEAPERAKQMAVAFHCDDAGTFRVLVDGELQGESRCSGEDTAYPNGGGYHSITGGGEHTLTITTARSNRIASCLTARGITPEPTMAGKNRQLNAIPLTVEKCLTGP